MASQKEQIPLAAITHARQFYAILEERATEEPLPLDPNVVYNTEDPVPTVLVFRGQLSDVFREMKVSQSFYTKIRAILIEYDCVSYLQKGTRAYDSVLILNHEPPEEISPEVLTRPSDPATLSVLADRLEDLEHSVKVLEKWRDSAGGINIGEALRNMELRLAKLER